MKKLLSIFAATTVLVCNAMAQSVEQEISVKALDGTMLNGTLLLPSLEQDSSFKVAVIVAGSGPTDRNGNQVTMLNNSLKMVAEGLAEHGIASIRYDKRGIGVSRMQALDESKLTPMTFADDLLEWIKLADADSRLGEVTVIGHSEGAKLAMIAYACGAPLDKIVELSGAGRTMDVLLKEQLSAQPEEIKNACCEIIDTLKKGNLYKNVPVYLNSLFRPSVQPYLISDMSLDPAELASNVSVPMLIVQGTTDIQVSVQDAMALSAANHEAELVIINDMNHVLKTCDTKDQNMQLMTYTNPVLPLHEELIPALVNFISK